MNKLDFLLFFSEIVYRTFRDHIVLKFPHEDIEEKDFEELMNEVEKIYFESFSIVKERFKNKYKTIKK